jgi:hypothetical protein
MTRVLVDRLSDHPSILENLAMPHFSNAQNVMVNGGIFFDVGGDVSFANYNQTTVEGV